MTLERKSHWERIYETKTPNQVSWTQEAPTISLNFIRNCKLPKTAQIIDVGSGDIKLVDYLLADGFENITVLDISEKALEKAQKRLGKKAEKVTWISCDVTKFKPEISYDLWHDRAAFHFLTSDEQIKKYQTIANTWVKGYMVIGTFSTNGPTKCSGLEIKQYNKELLQGVFKSGFNIIESEQENHITPFNTSQNFIFCSFKKK